MAALKRAAVALFLAACLVGPALSLAGQRALLRGPIKIKPSNFTAGEEQAKGLSCGTSIYSGSGRQNQDGDEHGGGGGGESEGEQAADGEHEADGDEGQSAGEAEGEASAELKKASNIVGGKEARPGEHPWLAKLLIDGKGHCGGSILSPHYVLTAAHCLYSCSKGVTYTADQISVVVGAHAKRRDGGGRVHRAERLIVHERYCTTFNEGNSPDDIGLVRLSTPISLGLQSKGYGSVNTICLPQAGTHYADRDLFQVAGWGQTRYDPNAPDYPESLQQVLVPHVEAARCEQLLANLLALPQPIQINFDANHEICAGGRENESSCKGDSGGPLTRAAGGGARELVGVVSRGQLCAHRDSPNIYARVDTYLDWIADNTRE